MLLEDVDVSVAISLLEELSRIDPFNADTWLKLSEQYLYAGRIDDAASAIDYAVAIRPEAVSSKHMTMTKNSIV